MKKSVLLFIQSKSLADNTLTILGEKVNAKLIYFPSTDDTIKFLNEHNCDLIIFQLTKSVDEHIECFANLNSMSTAPILSLLDSKEADMLTCLQYSEDCLFVPYIDNELIARTKALLNHPGCPVRTYRRTDTLYRHGLVIMGQFRKVYFGKREVKLTRTEFNILKLLAQREGQVFSREQIYDAIWQGYCENDITVLVNNHIQRLRNKLSKYSKHEFITAVWGIGYRFNP